MSGVSSVYVVGFFPMLCCRWSLFHTFNPHSVDLTSPFLTFSDSSFVFLCLLFGFFCGLQELEHERQWSASLFTRCFFWFFASHAPTHVNDNLRTQLFPNNYFIKHLAVKEFHAYNYIFNILYFSFFLSVILQTKIYCFTRAIIMHLPNETGSR